MKAIADTGGIVALLDSADKNHAAVVSIVNTSELLLPVTILAEVDYLVTKYLGESVARIFLEDVTTGAFTYLASDLLDMSQTLKIITISSNLTRCT